MEKVYKTFGGTIKALQGADFSVEKGEIHALIGENAAGKSTLMNILFGSLKPDSGEIYINDKLAEINSPSDAINLKIGMVHQHFKLVPGFTVLENVILGYEYKYVNQYKKIDYKAAGKDVQDILDRLSVELDLNAVTGGLPIGMQSKVEIIKCLFKGAELLILDEPTTVLAPTEVSYFFEFLRRLRDQGVTIIYISHRLKEIFEITDSITVLRKGQTVATMKTSEGTMEEITSLMIGKDIKEKDFVYSKKKEISGNTILELKGVSVKGRENGLQSVSFHIRQGEILGVAGIGGNGQVELADALIGVIRTESGEVLFKGENITELSTKERRDRGIHYVPDDRINKGLAMSLSITENSIVGYERRAPVQKNRLCMNWKAAEHFAEEVSSNYYVEGIGTVSQPIGSLSGGNMQKVLVGRELCMKPDLLILSQPTSGIDFNAQRQLHTRFLERQKEGGTILLISEDLDELMNLSDRIIVLYRGRVVAEFSDKEKFDEKELGYYMTGVKGFENEGKI